MSRGRRESPWLVACRCLMIVRRLKQSPATKAELSRAVREVVPDAYAAATTKAQRKQFNEDMRRVRDELQATIHYDRRAGVYILVEPGPFLSLELSPQALRGLYFLLTTFDREDAATEVVTPLLELVQTMLASEQRKQLERPTPELELDLRHLDEAEIDPVVWQKVQQAHKLRRLLQFDYISRPPRVVRHIVEPHHLRFKDGHYVLHAYCRRWQTPDETRLDAGWFDYRLTWIQPGLELLPGRFAPRLEKRTSILVRYRLSPQIHHQGKVTPRFDKMEVSPIEPDGWVTVTGKTDNLFTARRILLSYGENCQVLAPPELRRQFKIAAQKMNEFYENE